VRLVSWNVAGRLRRQPEQAAAVLAVAPDVVALQEVTKNSVGLWREALADAGLIHSVTPLDDGPLPKPRRLAVLTAGREPLERLSLDGLPWPERAVAARIGAIEILNVHSPISPSPGLAKVLTHEALYAYARTRSRIVLCGDLNTPRRTHEDGTVLTFAHDTKGRLREERGERWAPRSARSSTPCAPRTAGPMPFSTRRSGRGSSRTTGAAGASTTCSSRTSRCAPGPTPTTGGGAA
jgi:exonuclease III